MIPEMLALTASLMWAFANVLAKKGLNSSNAYTALYLSLVIGVATYLLLALAFEWPGRVDASALLLFVAGGLFASMVGRQLTIIGIRRAGASVSTTILGSVPLFASFAAVILLREVMTLPIVVGTAAVVVGVGALNPGRKGPSTFRGRDIVTLLCAASLFAAADIAWKAGFNIMNTPLFGVTVSTAGALAAATLYLPVHGKRLIILNRRCAAYYVPAGVCWSAAVLFLSAALNLGEVIIVAPLTSTTPLFALLLTALFLKGVERVTLRVVFAAVLVVAGAALITAF